MFDRLPPLQALRAFEATARLLSMSRAAEELHLTHGAVSRQIKTLENDLGVRLFTRMTRRIVLTEAGAAFHVAVVRALGDLMRETQHLRGHAPGKRLSISTSVSFATKWLAPRLHRLKAQYPQYDVHLDVTDTNVDLRSSLVDVAIRYGVGNYPHAESERVLDEFVSPVCSPDHLAQHGALSSPSQLLDCTLLHEDRMLANWDQWFSLAGVGRRRARQGGAYSHGSMAIEAAIRGEGVALGRSTLAADDVGAGRLMVLFPALQLKAERGYDLVYRIGARHDPKVELLRKWLMGEIATFLGSA